MKTPLLSYCIASPLSNWRSAAVLLLFLSALPLSALDFASEGEKQLGLNNPGKAVTYLEAAVAQGATDEKLLLNLGLAYQRVGQSAEARKTFRQGADLAGPGRKTFLLNLGVSAFLAQDFAAAEEAYTAALTADPQFAEARLNRANTRLSLQDWAGSADDYRAYQTAAPANPQKEKIDQIIALLDQTAVEAAASKVAEEARQKKAAEEKKAAAEASAAAEQKAADDKKAAEDAAAAQAEAARQAEEAAAEAERKKQDEILARIRESLAGAGDDSKALSTGPSAVKADDSEATLD